MTLVRYEFCRGPIVVRKTDEEVEPSDTETDSSDIGYHSLSEFSHEKDLDLKFYAVFLARSCLCGPVCAALFDLV